ncbi:CDP-alcohol phosphatidyltransferase family protein [Parasediminibacterium sp. JCM 36343]|uniref:CDP-alcohol phosphatidyltransferase family protein n=1 Tax=Parasediminibacterium sp. JCM 36343 TaxID=3374279 RepID=UPI00397881D1
MIFYTRYIPKLLIYSRLLIGGIILMFSYLHISYYPVIAVVLFTIGLLTDIFDGIIARHLNISTQHLRRLDSTIDQIFFLCVLIATYIECPQFFLGNKIQMVIILLLEGLAYLVCFLKFRKEVATHSISSKLWVLVLFSTLIQVMLTCNAGVLFQLSFYIGLITRLEIIGIILLLKNWANDVPGIYHAVLIRKGKPIKRHKLFNG